MPACIYFFCLKDLFCHVPKILLERRGLPKNWLKKAMGFPFRFYPSSISSLKFDDVFRFSIEPEYCKRKDFVYDICLVFLTTLSFKNITSDGFLLCMEKIDIRNGLNLSTFIAWTVCYRYHYNFLADGDKKP